MANYYSAQAYLSKAASDLEIAKAYARKLSNASDLKSIEAEASILIASLNKLSSALEDQFDQSVDYSMFRIREPERSKELYRASFICGVMYNVNDTLNRASCLINSESAETGKLNDKLIDKSLNEATYAVRALIKEKDQPYSELTAEQVLEHAEKDKPICEKVDVSYFEEIDEALDKAVSAADSAKSRDSRMRILDHASNIQVWKDLMINELERLDEAIVDSTLTKDKGA